MTRSQSYINSYPRSNRLLELIEGDSLYTGCRNALVLAAIDQYGVNVITEILGKLSDVIVLEAVETSLQYMGVLDTEEE